ncbi:PEP-CTERM sorting domain-containing protein [Algisphaera agarilytica]|uniref:Ice-binding protein C-terminal domain-containing protein n=1 Tax=Algisphaera agarilytica TaxID=1385975 RepID=A0A7X0H3I7_9BACT|nr:PEP-CTERM sorting domain-containing protein [Algisphaera agarilytica]MBB6428392.1 hypothetical protein [Algisphaera agarilytica]
MSNSLAVVELKHVAALAVASAALSLPAVGQVVVVDDNFAVDGTVSTDAAYFGSSSSTAIEFNANSIGLVTGPSGRQMHALFDTVSLAQGESLVATIDFTTPTSISTTGGDDFKFGVFDHLGRDNASQLAQNTSYSTASPNADYSGLPGFMVELDVEPSDPATDIQIRRSDPSTSGRLLGTNTGISSLSSSADMGYVFAPNTAYTLSITIERTLADELDISSTFLGVTHSDTDDSPVSFDFGMLAFGASTNAFGTSNTPGEMDNGIDLTRVNVVYNPIPEPGSMALISLGGLALLRRRSSK